MATQPSRRCISHLTLENFVENCLPWEGPHTGEGEECEEEGAVETMCDKMTAAPIPRPSVLLRAGGGREYRSAVKPGKKERVGGKCFISHYPTLI